MANADDAVKWYAKAVKSKTRCRNLLQLCSDVKIKGKYVEADGQMRVFVAMSPNDPEAIEFNKNPDYLIKLKK